MTTPWPIVALISLLGLLIGSFLNVVIFRVPRSQSIVHPSSHCPHCDTHLTARHNVPVVSWLVLRGRCAYCKQSINARYPLVEAGTAALFAAITLRIGMRLELPAYLYLGAVGVTLALIDFDKRRLPDTIVLPSYVVAALLLMPAGAQAGDWRTAVRALGGAIALAAIYSALALAYPRGLSLGDVKVAGLLGLYLGWMSWSALLIGAIGGLVIGALSDTSLLVGGSRKRGVSPAGGVSIAFTQSLITAAVLALFVTVPLSSWYSALLSTS